MTLGTIKMEKHLRWLAKKQQRKEVIIAQMKEQEKKIKIYKKYNHEQGVRFTLDEQDKLFGP